MRSWNVLVFSLGESLIPRKRGCRKRYSSEVSLMPFPLKDSSCGLSLCISVVHGKGQLVSV